MDFIIILVSFLMILASFCITFSSIDFLLIFDRLLQPSNFENLYKTYVKTCFSKNHFSNKCSDLASMFKPLFMFCCSFWHHFRHRFWYRLLHHFWTDFEFKMAAKISHRGQFQPKGLKRRSTFIWRFRARASWI